jgi:hypothetical protein
LFRFQDYERGSKPMSMYTKFVESIDAWKQNYSSLISRSTDVSEKITQYSSLERTRTPLTRSISRFIPM